jgi:hypothetical protein
MEKLGFEMAPKIPENIPDGSIFHQKIEKAGESADGKAEEKGVNRRDFLKYCLALAGGLVAESITGQTEKAEAAVGIFGKAKSYIKNKIQGYEMIIYRRDKDLETVNKVLDFKSNKPIQIDAKTAEKTKEYWKMEYMGNPKMSNSLISAYSEMERNWTPRLKKIFEEEGVPVKYLYLAIPESHWNWKEDSPAGAVGPYQFMADTGRKFGLKIDGRIDERLDPIKSGRACAKYLKYLFGVTGDRDLALAGYNGGLIWDYIKYAKNNSEELSYKNFLRYISQEANRYKKEHYSGNYKVEVGEKDTLQSLAKKYGTSEKVILRANNLKTKHIKAGSNLIIPVKSKKIQGAILARRKATLSENLNYPPKFNAVMELIEEGIS